MCVCVCVCVCIYVCVYIYIYIYNTIERITKSKILHVSSSKAFFHFRIQNFLPLKEIFTRVFSTTLSHFFQKLSSLFISRTLPCLSHSPSLCRLKPYPPLCRLKLSPPLFRLKRSPPLFRLKCS